MSYRRLIVIAVLLLLMSACASKQSLRSLGDERNIEIGTASGTWHLDEPDYISVLTTEFRLLVPEAQMNFRYIHPEVGRFDFSAPDRLCDFAKRNKLRVRGHTLVWESNNLPEWVKNQKLTPENRSEILKNHIQTVIRHFKQKYPGLIQSWVVVNEAIAEDGSLIPSIWASIGTTRQDYIELAFRWAHEADPDAKLFYNEKHAEGRNPRSDRMYALLKEMRRKGVPISGVGFQMHLSTRKYPDLAEVRFNMRRISELDLEIGITEMDIRTPLEGSDQNREAAMQAKLYADYVHACTETPSCRSVVFWGFTDKYSWVPEYFNNRWGNALIFDESYRKKAAYNSVSKALK